MEIPPPAVPTERLADWRQTDATIERAFSTPVVNVETHTLVFEETTQRDRIRAETGIDQPWRFFFVSRIRLDPPRQPSLLLTPLVRSESARDFADRLAARGFSQIDQHNRTEMSVGQTTGLRFDYRAIYRLRSPDGDHPEQHLSLPVAASLAVWHDGYDYHVAGGAYPSDKPDSAPEPLYTALTASVDPEAARTELLGLIEGCGPPHGRKNT